MVEQEAVNFEVAGSSPVPGAKNKKLTQRVIFLFFTFQRLGENQLQLVRTDDEVSKNLIFILDFSSEENSLSKPAQVNQPVKSTIAPIKTPTK